MIYNIHVVTINVTHTRPILSSQNIFSPHPPVNTWHIALLKPAFFRLSAKLYIANEVTLHDSYVKFDCLLNNQSYRGYKSMLFLAQYVDVFDGRIIRLNITCLGQDACTPQYSRGLPRIYLRSTFSCVKFRILVQVGLGVFTQVIKGNI